MSQGPEMRAGDEDRDKTVTLVREAYAEGRLSAEEFQQRMEQAQESKTYGELAALVSDLPTRALAPAAPVAPPHAAAVAVPEEDNHNIRNGWAAWAGVSVMVNVIWLATWRTGDGGAPPYWPIWVMGPWGAAMVIGTLSKRDR